MLSNYMNDKAKIIKTFVISTGLVIPQLIKNMFVPSSNYYCGIC